MLQRRPEDELPGAAHDHLSAARGSFVWFYKWHDQALDSATSSSLFATTDQLRNTIDRAVKVMFTKKRGLHGSPRLHANLRDDGGRSTRRP